MKNPTPIEAIRQKCLDCCSNEMQEIKGCMVLDCPIWKFRLGLHPFTEKNSKNPFLDTKRFEGYRDKQMTARQIIDSIEGDLNELP